MDVFEKEEEKEEESEEEEESEDVCRRIQDARALAYASRELRRQRAMALDYRPIMEGSIFTTRTLIPPQLVESLRADALALEVAGQFSPSGLSTAHAAQVFGDADRLVCKVILGLGGDYDARREFKRHLEALCHAAGAALGRSLIIAEQYYSIHRQGAFLQRHMDEKHEELKGSRGWATSYRRSLSWLFYLSDEHSGGELRGYCRHVASGAGTIGANAGDLQVGWLAVVSTESMMGATKQGQVHEPVYMDCWVQTPSLMEHDERVLAGEVAGIDYVEVPHQMRCPLSRLYRVGPPGGREWLSSSFDIESLRVVCHGSTLSADDLAQQLPKELRGRFSSLDGVPDGTHICDITANGGTLAVFDSVCLPHEVLPTTAGTRVAMAGWFHEPQRAFPAWFDADITPGKRRPLTDLPPVRSAR